MNCNGISMLLYQLKHDSLQALPAGTWAVAGTQAGMEIQAWQETQTSSGSCAEGKRPAQDRKRYHPTQDEQLTDFYHFPIICSCRVVFWDFVVNSQLSICHMHQW